MMEQFDFKAYSELIGLIPPDDIEPDVYLPFDYSACGCVVCEQHKHIKLPGQSLVELELASRPHRWKKMREIQKNFYNAMAEEVVKAEIDLLKLLKLPDIDTIRQAEAGEDVSVRGKFEYTAKMKLGHERIVKDFQEAIVGDRELVKVEKKSPFDLPHSKVINPGLENAIFGYFMRSALGEGLEQLYRQLILNLPEGMTEADIDKTRVLPQLSNEYFAAAVNIGAMRIRTKISAKNMDALKEALKDMAKSGDNPMVVGRYLHKNYGELALWEWNRIARSESALMVNAAFDVQSRAAGVKYEKWSAALNACPICTALDGRTWDLQGGPLPVQDTHPHCTLYHAKITTPDGLKFIRDIQVGDLVLTHSGRFMPVTVKHEHQELTATMVRIVAGNTMLDITDNHPVLICSGDSFVWVSAEKLRPGDQIIRGNKNGMAPVKVDGIEKYRLENVWLYNLTVAEDESYFAESILVHNCLCIRIPLYNYTGPVQNPWIRTNPYDLRYSPDEIAGLPAYLNGERRPGTGLVPEAPPLPQAVDIPVDVNKFDDARRAFNEYARDNFTDADLEVIKDYTENQYTGWNAYLRQYKKTGAYKPFDEKIENLDFILEKAPKFKGTTYRGLGFDNSKKDIFGDIISKNTGDIFTDNGFLSSSVDKSVAEKFAKMEYKVLMEIRGKNGSAISSFSSIEGESEVLFRYGSSFKLISKSEIKENYFYMIFEEL